VIGLRTQTDVSCLTLQTHFREERTMFFARLFGHPQSAAGRARMSRRGRQKTLKQPGAHKLFSRLRLERLEDRTLLSIITVLNNADSGDGPLRAALAAAASGDTINFAPDLSGQTITLTSGELVINQSLDIEGLGASRLTISGNDASRV